MCRGLEAGTIWGALGSMGRLGEVAEARRSWGLGGYSQEL